MPRGHGGEYIQTDPELIGSVHSELAKQIPVKGVAREKEQVARGHDLCGV